MGRRKRKLTAAERAAKKKRQEEYETIFIRGKMKRIRRSPTVEGMSVDDFIRANADPIFLLQEEPWEYLEAEGEIDMDSGRRRSSVTTADGRELVSFITTQGADDLIVAYAIALDDAGEIASLILQRTPKYEIFLPPDERGVSVSHELHPRDDHELVRRVVVDGSHVDIETTTANYRLDVSAVDPEEAVHARQVLLRMHQYGGLELESR